MKLFLKLSLMIALVTGFIHSLNLLSYHFLKNRILKRQKWDLNLCCGKTDGGGINADIVKHKNVPNLVIVDIYNLPFKPKQFKSVLCSHTIEHVERPMGLFIELTRVGRTVTLVTPPLWDISAALNVLEHKWIYWSLYTEHKRLPYYTPLPFSTSIQNLFGQRIKA